MTSLAEAGKSKMASRRSTWALATFVSLGACGGGERVESTPPPTVAQPPVSTPPPTAPVGIVPKPNPTPSGQGFDDNEYARSNAAVAAGAIAAYRADATGEGIKIGIIDTGINAALPEFAGRIDNASRDVAASRGLTDPSGHGTAVSSVALAARDGAGIHGVAFRASLVSLNVASADCSPASCRIADADVARALHGALDAGVRVINISLSTATAKVETLNAVGRAADAGVVVVIAAGNQGLSDPVRSALQVADAGRGVVIIAGAHDADGAIRASSNRAGVGALSSLFALGSDVWTINAAGGVTQQSGTSLAAPAISGAVALLAQSFPNLSGRQIVDLLLRTGTDAGDAGVDAVYGNGLLSIARAFAPSGTLRTHAGIAMTMAGTTLQLSPTMGDAKATVRTLMLDDLDRAYTASVDLGVAAPLEPVIASAAQAMRSAGFDAGPFSVAFTLAPHSFAGASPHANFGSDWRQPPSVTSTRLAARLGSGTGIAMGTSIGMETLVDQLTMRPARISLLANHGRSRTGFAASSALTGAIRQVVGGGSIALAVEQGRLADPGADQAAYDRIGAALDQPIGPAVVSVDLVRTRERRSVLGGRLASDQADRGAATSSVAFSLVAPLSARWRVGGAYRVGSTRVSAFGPLRGGSLMTNDWSADLTADSLFAEGDVLTFRVAQPLRVGSGGLIGPVATGYDYATRALIVRDELIRLTPDGREVDLEVGYGLRILGGDAGAHAFFRHQPGHRAQSAADVGAMIRWHQAF